MWSVHSNKGPPQDGANVPFYQLSHKLHSKTKWIHFTLWVHHFFHPSTVEYLHRQPLIFSRFCWARLKLKQQTTCRIAAWWQHGRQFLTIKIISPSSKLVSLMFLHCLLSFLLFYTLKHFLLTQTFWWEHKSALSHSKLLVFCSVSAALQRVSARATVMFSSRQSPTPELNLATDAYPQMQLDTAEWAAVKPVLVHYVISRPPTCDLAALTSASEVASSLSTLEYGV